MISEPVRAFVKVGKYEKPFRFFEVFRLFEYALKNCGFLLKVKKLKGKKGDASSDWDTFARTHEQWFTDERKNEPAFRRVAKRLFDDPPRKQKLNDSETGWIFEADNYAGDKNLERLLCLVRRVRNNYFHGAKFFADGRNDKRDFKLIADALLILAYCATANKDVQATIEKALLPAKITMAP